MIEPDYYPLAMAAEKIGCKTDYLILLATENKLSIYVRKCGIAPLIPSETDLRHVSIYAMQRYQNNRGAELTLTDPNDSRYEYGSCDEVLVKDVALLVLAEDVARLSKKETVKTAVSENERNTMLKLIIGMAMDAYGYDKDKTRNDATGTNKGSIKAGLEKNGINVDDDTIRKYLKEAKNIL